MSGVPDGVGSAEKARDDAWGWELRMFLSVDVVDSTKLKQSDPGRPENKGKWWASAFHEFFRDFPDAFQLGIEQVRGELPAAVTPAVADAPIPEVWKFLGDEILFTLPIRRIRHTSLYISGLLRAMSGYARKLKEKNPKDPPLEFKGAAWIAGFPVRNYRLVLSSGIVEAPANGSGRPPSVVDFIGPHMDLGFRIGKCSGKDSMALAPDLALLLLLSKDRLGLSESPIVLYDGREDLKGVSGKIPVVHARSSFPSKQEIDERLARGWSDTWPPGDAVIRRFLAAYVEQEFALGKPFVNGDDDFPEFASPGPYLEAERDALRNAKVDDMKQEGLGEESAPTGDETLASPLLPPETIRGDSPA